MLPTRIYKFTYTNRKGEVRTRIVMPIDLVAHNNNVTIYGWDFTKDDYRNFLFNRIEDTEDVTDKSLRFDCTAPGEGTKAARLQEKHPEYSFYNSEYDNSIYFVNASNYK